MCGIFGCINKNPRLINKSALNMLGFANDTRGGDSCGVFIDRAVDFGIEKNKLYSNFFKESKLLKDLKKARVVLGHCRKASVGKISENTAQPVVITNKKSGEIEFVLIHNGTIINWEALATKYLKDVPEHYTDSYVMAYIFYYHGFEVLKEYIGAGAFVIADYREDSIDPFIYMFKGESKAYSYSQAISEERPLFINTEAMNDSIWFSSISLALEGALDNKGETYSALGNTLYTFHKGVILEMVEYDRSHQFQNISQIASISSNGTAGYWDAREHWEEESSYKKPSQAPQLVESVQTSSINRSPLTERIIKIENEYKNYFGLILHSDGKYYSGAKPATGFYSLSIHTKGAIVGGLYFFNGFIINKKEVYDIIVDSYQTLRDLEESNITEEEFCECFGGEFYNNVSTPIYDEETQLVYFNGNLFTGNFFDCFNPTPYKAKVSKGKAEKIYEIEEGAKLNYLRTLFNHTNSLLNPKEEKRLKTVFLW